MEDEDFAPYFVRAKEWSKQRKRTKYIAMMQFFLLGAEFSLIIPTLAFYLRELHASNVPVFFGMIHGAYGLAGILSALVLGRLVDTTLRFRISIAVINATTIAGNALYTMGYSPYVLIVARFLSGVVESVYPIIYGELARCYTADEFPRQGAHLMTAFCLGFSASPGLNMVPKEKVLNLGFVAIRYTNAPGAILFCLYSIQFLTAVFGLTDLSLNKQRYKLDVRYLRGKELNGINESINKEEDEELLKKDLSKRMGSDEKIVVSERPWWIILLELFKRREVLILLYGQVVWAYSLVNGVVLLPITAIKYLHFNHQQVSVFYIGSGVVFALVLFLNSRLISKYGPVRACIAAFLMSFISSLFLYLTVVAAGLSISVRALFFVVFGLYFFLSWFLNSVALRATLSRHTPMEDQAFCQGVFTMAEQFSALAAALTSGFVFSLIELYCCWSAAINLLAVIIFAASYRLLEDDADSSSSEEA